MRFLCLILLLLATPATAGRLPYLCGDETNPAECAKLPFNALTDPPVSCNIGFFVHGLVEGTTNTWDCRSIASGTPSDGDCPKWDAGLGYPVWGPCGSGGSGTSLVVLGDDYCFFGLGGVDKLIYYTGS